MTMSKAITRHSTVESSDTSSSPNSSAYGYSRKSKRFSFRAVSSHIIYDYALRCAIRAYLEQTGERPETPSSLSTHLSITKKKDEHRFSQIYNFPNLADKLSSSSSSSVDDSKKNGKLTQDLVKGILKRLEDIYKAPESNGTAENDALEKKFRTVCKMTKKHLQQEKKLHRTGTINDVVVQFLKISEAELKVLHPNNPAIWYDDLNTFLSRFVDLVIQTLQYDAPSSATPEVLDKLSAFCTPSTTHSPKWKSSSVDHSRGSSTYNHQTSSAGDSCASAVLTVDSLLNYPMIKLIQQLFKINQEEHRQKLKELIPICTVTALIYDLKKCINNVHKNEAFPGRKEDFASSLAYEQWQKKEVKQLTELLNSLMLMNPNLRLADSINEDDNDSTEFTFIPNDPKRSYRFLMSLCLNHDIEQQQANDRDAFPATGLSQQSDDLLRECWRTWRLSSPFRAILYLNLLKPKVDANELDVHAISDAMRSLDKVMKEYDISMWPSSDVKNAVRAFESIQNTLMRKLAEGLSEYWKISPQWIEDIVDILEKIHTHPVYAEAHPDITADIIQLEECIKGAAVERWSNIEQLINDPSRDILSNLYTMADKLCKELGSIARKRFSQPIFGVLSIPELIMARQLPYFALEMENWVFSPDFKTCPIDRTFQLYDKVLSLQKLYDKYGSEAKKSLFKVESWFLPHVKRWIIKTNDSTKEWVENAIAQDTFQQYSDVIVHSSSVIDLFAMFTQAVDFIAGLQWPNDVQYCTLKTYLAKLIAESIDLYCRALENLIRQDVSLNTDDTVVAGSTLLEKAKNQLIGARTLYYNKGYSNGAMLAITAELCTKLNDIEAARDKLDRLYQLMHVDEIAQFMRENNMHLSSLQQQANYNNMSYHYTIRVVRAENLKPMDRNGLSDPYVVFEMDGKPVIRTKTVYETLNPRWDQEFDIVLRDNAVDICAIVNDEDVITADDECGVTWFTLSPKFNAIYHQDDLILDLAPQGKLVLRITMEDEKNDIQFYFGKAFRTLKTSSIDAAWLIVDKMTPFIRQCLSRHTISKVLGRNRNSFFSFNRIVAVTEIETEPDLQACEDAIAPLIEFMEYNLHILNENLTETNMQLVVSKIWKQIIKTIKDIMVPPLSENLSQVKPLDIYEMHVILKWLELLKVLFNGGEDGDAIPLETLENDEYYSLLAVNFVYYMDTHELMSSYKIAETAKLSTGKKASKKPPNRTKSVYHSRSTIRRKKVMNEAKNDSSTTAQLKVNQKEQYVANLPDADDILRILRMRQDADVAAFLNQEFNKRNDPTTANDTSNSIRSTKYASHGCDNSMSLLSSEHYDGISFETKDTAIRMPTHAPPPLPDHGLSL
ncbi:hypothetical protein BDF20DRAFT_960679 [Mycotypha africana]|uniref:uncharacterized protein n=1 Tax=Mycotypha africana TaxID=64632 RepID=UPI00230079AE|nr:uncharacterized protein BDF20DRAFT_960679 [Mycotypha africana]KAI8973443.1 hypothetical protein BDF20DRAFT_960679 [Mycotypha africana]